MEAAIDFEPKKILAANPDRQPITIKNMGEFSCKVILNGIADRTGNSVEINLPSGGETEFDGTYKGEVWCRTLSSQAETALEIIE